MFLDRCLTLADRILNLIQTSVSLIAALETITATDITQAFQVEGVRKLKEPILGLRQRTQIIGRRFLKTLGSLKRRYNSSPSPTVEDFGKKSALTTGTAVDA